MLVIEPDAADGRVKKLRTTGHSREYWQQRSADDQRYVLEWFAGLSAPEARALSNCCCGCTRESPYEQARSPDAAGLLLDAGRVGGTVPVLPVREPDPGAHRPAGCRCDDACARARRVAVPARRPGR